MSYRPPFARMREIRQRAAWSRPDPVKATAPANVEAALEEANNVTEDVAPEPDPVPVQPEAGPGDDAAPEPVGDGGDTAGVSMDMKRSDLDALALSLGVKNPEKLPNKQAVIDAIHEAQGAV